MDSEGARSGQTDDLVFGTDLDDGGPTVRLQGVVDGAAARALCERLADLASRCRDRIVLDFSGVEEISEFGAALLSHGLRSRPNLLEKLSLARASQHFQRRLGRFGVDSDPG